MSSFQRNEEPAAAFERATGRRPRLLIAGISPDITGDAVVVGFAGAGFDVDVGPATSSAAGIARQAVDADVHLIGLRNPTDPLIAELRAALAELGGSEIGVVAITAAAGHPGAVAVVDPAGPTPAVIGQLVELLSEAADD